MTTITKGLKTSQMPVIVTVIQPGPPTLFRMPPHATPPAPIQHRLRFIAAEAAPGFSRFRSISKLFSPENELTMPKDCKKRNIIGAASGVRACIVHPYPRRLIPATISIGKVSCRRATCAGLVVSAYEARSPGGSHDGGSSNRACEPR